MASAFRKRPSKAVKISPYSYYRSNDANFTKNAKVKSLNKVSRLVRFVTQQLSVFRIIVVLAGLILAVYLMSASTAPIVRISSSGVNARETSIYREEIQSILRRSILNRSKLLFDYRGVEESIREKFSEIESVQISFDLVGRKPVIKLITLEPAYIFETNGQSWIIDRRGVAIGLQSELTDSFTASLHTVTDEVGTVAEVGSTLMSAKQIDFLTSVIKLLDKQLVIVKDVFLTGSPREIDLLVSTDSWRYKLNIDEKPTGQAGTLIASQVTLKLAGKTPSEYVDLRAGEKVFWK